MYTETVLVPPLPSTVLFVTVLLLLNLHCIACNKQSTLGWHLIAPSWTTAAPAAIKPLPMGCRCGLARPLHAELRPTPHSLLMRTEVALLSMRTSCSISASCTSSSCVDQAVQTRWRVMLLLHSTAAVQRPNAELHWHSGERRAHTSASAPATAAPPCAAAWRVCPARRAAARRPG